MGNIYLKIGNAALAHINLALTPRCCNVATQNPPLPSQIKIPL